MLRLKTGRSSVMRPNRNAPGQKKTAMPMKMLRYYSYGNGGVLQTENSVEQPLRAECGGKEGFELTGQDPWYVAQTLRHREKLAELQLDAFPRFRKTVRHA